MEDKKVQVLLEDIKSQFKAFGEWLGLVRKKTDAIFEAVGKLQVDLTQVKSDIKAIKGRLSELESKVTSLNLEQSVTNVELKDIKGRLVSIEEELQGIRKDIKTKPEREEVEEMEKRVVLLENKLKI